MAFSLARKPALKTSTPGAPPPGAPLTAHEKARVEWFERYGSAVVERNRFFVLLMILFAVVGAQGIAIYAMLPLKTVEPYVIKVDSNGAVAAAPAAAQRYKPGKPETTYFLAQWTVALLTLDPYLTERNLTDAYMKTRGTATHAFQDWVKNAKPFERMRSDRSLTRTVTINTVSYVDENAVALVRVRTEERSLSNPTVVKNYLLTVHFLVVPPQTEREIYENPIGLYVKHFAISEEQLK